QEVNESLTRSGHRNDEFTVFFRNEISAAAARTSVCVLLFDADNELLGRPERETNFAAGRRLLRFGCLLRVLGRKSNQFDLGNLPTGFPSHHHFVEFDNSRICAGSIKKRFEGRGVFGFERGFVFVDKRFLVTRRRAGKTKARDKNNKPERKPEFHKRLSWSMRSG